MGPRAGLYILVILHTKKFVVPKHVTKVQSLSYTASRAELSSLKFTGWFAGGTYNERDNVPSAIQNS